MAHRDIVVIGASAGGVEALVALVRELPADLPAALFVVMHVPPYAASRLPEILQRSGPLPASHARAGELIAPGRIVVAPPDRHLVLRRGWVELSRGPRENHVRPAIDALFRSAARAYGSRVVGVIMSGALSDGTAGLLAIKTRGGVAIVQDPSDAAVEDMPRSAMRIVSVDHVLPAPAIAARLSELARQPVRREEASPIRAISSLAQPSAKPWQTSAGQRGRGRCDDRPRAAHPSRMPAYSLIRTGTKSIVDADRDNFVADG
jgi:two-component system chemotaxis response regulator CheB